MKHASKLLVGFFLLAFPWLVFTQVPELINYQALLTNPATGQSVADGTFQIIFSIYDVATGGTATWTETQNVTTQSGLYAVLLGSTTPITSTILNGPEKYLGIKVESDPEMTPRKRIVSVAYAIVSGDADKLDGQDASEFATKAELSTSDGDPPNQGSNQVSWDNLKDMPAGFVDGVDDAGVGAGNTLDQAYDQGGAGVGRTITADAGAVKITGAGGLEVDANTILGASTSTTETLANAGFSLGGDDLFVAGQAGIESDVFTDGSFIAGSTTTYGDGAITKTTGSALNVNLGAAAGDDFIVDTNTLVVESDNNRVGIGTTSPASKLAISGGLSIGSGFTDDSAPTNSAIIEGTLAVGTTDPNGFPSPLTTSVAAFAGDLGKEDVIHRLATAGQDRRPAYIFVTSRGTLAVPTSVNSFDGLGAIIAFGHDGNTFQNAARIDFEIGGTPGPGDMPGRIRFATTPGGSASLVTRMTISENGNVGIGTIAPEAELEVTGNIIAEYPFEFNHVATKEYVDDQSIIKSIQRGRVTGLTGFHGTVDIDINAVDLSKSFFIVNGGTEFTTAIHTATTTYGEFISSTLLRVGYNSGYTLLHTVSWQVIEYK